ncbi:hypothetical protein SRIMM317S_02983 [Streptomyces rimosus subsp. rimosus]
MALHRAPPASTMARLPKRSASGPQILHAHEGAAAQEEQQPAQYGVGDRRLGASIAGMCTIHIPIYETVEGEGP